MMFTKEIPVPFVELIWDDAEADNEWKYETDEEEDELSALVHTVGFLVKETKTAYYISHTVSTDGEGTLHWNSRIRIPKGMIRSYKVLVKAS
jgi:hypothetical protein